MIRCCTKFSIPLPTRSNSPVCLSRFYVASSTNNVIHRRYSSDDYKPPRRLKKIFFTTVGITLLGVGGAVVYAKNDPKFRKVLESYVPGSDKFISIIYQEGDTLSIDFITDKLSTIPDKVLSLPSEVYKQISSGSGEEASSPLPKVKQVDSSHVQRVKPEPLEESKKKIEIHPVQHDTSAKAQITVEHIEKAEREAERLFQDIMKLIDDNAGDIIGLIDKAVEDGSLKVWNEVREQVDKNKKVLEQLDVKSKELGEQLKKFNNLLKSSNITEEALDKGKASQIQKFKDKVDSAKSKLLASNKYYENIRQARNNFLDELGTLFPSFKVGDGELKVAEDEIDLFLYYAYQKLQYYQKELKKLEDQALHRVNKALQDSKEYGPEVQEAINVNVEKSRRELKEQFDKRILELKDQCDKDLHNQMKRQEQVHLDLLNDQLLLKEKEVERKLIQRLEDRVLEEQTKLQAELAEMTGRMQGLNEAISKRALQDQKAQFSQALWSATEALYSILKNSNSKDEKPSEPKPLCDSVEAIRNAAAKGDDLVETVLATIPARALTCGVYPEDVLKERFLKVEKVAWRVAGVPEGGCSLPMLMVAWLQSALIIRASEPIPSPELNNEPFDPSELNNYDILQRARYWVDRGDFEQALKYMNLLKGGARSVSLDWMKEVTLLLETQQAAHLLLAHASASGMIYS